MIAIAHRLFSAHDADRVAVVEDGRIAELGSHDELVAAGGSYAALWESWNGGRAPAGSATREVDQSWTSGSPPAPVGGPGGTGDAGTGRVCRAVAADALP